MFGFIKKLFGGIFAFFGGLVGGKKSQDDKSIAPKTQENKSTAPKTQEDKSTALKTKKGRGYYLELDESGNTQAVAEGKNPQPVKAAVATAEKPKAEEANGKQPEPAKAAVATAEKPKAEPAAKAKKLKSTQKEVPSKDETVKVEAQPNPPAPALNGKVEPQAEMTFAPNYLLPTASRSRRRPGPSMDMFRDMARQVKTPS
jgi:hypothetical protein